MQPKTSLKKLDIKKFRALNDVCIEFGSHLTVICGKNGTSKSSILGIAAQIFSFEKDYSSGEELSFETITGANFKSLPTEHFRFSTRFDVPGSLDVRIELTDGYTGRTETAELELSSRTVRGKPIARPVVRKNSAAKDGNSSRNFTHPVIFLSLKRLQPIATREYKVHSFEYLDAHRDDFIALNNEILNKSSAAVTGTSGALDSAVAFSNNYDQDSVSVGEDNVGQIVLALMSFRKLKEEYADYKGGLLLIDEADAGLFPAAQLQLIDIIEKECTRLNLQVVVTSHSPTLIERTYELSKIYQRKFKTVYLSDTFGPVRAMPDLSWPEIFSDLHVETIALSNERSAPRINTYFEDAEGADFFDKLVARQSFKKILRNLRDVSLGCTNYVQLIKKGVPEFASKSLIVLDADASSAKTHSTVVLLPGALPPDQLIFEFLYNLPADDPIWRNQLHFTRPVFTKVSRAIITALKINGEDTVDIGSLVSQYRSGTSTGKSSARDIFKAFYKNEEFQAFLKIKGAANPWRRWLSENEDLVAAFREEAADKVKKILKDGFGIETPPF